MVTFDNSSTCEDFFDDIHKLILDLISSHICSIVAHGGFGAVSTDDNKEYGCYILQFTSDPYTLQ